MLICVDLDGTLLDTVPANAASYRAALEEQALPSPMNTTPNTATAAIISSFYAR